jgi:6-phosphogluconolactonase
MTPNIAIYPDRQSLIDNALSLILDRIEAAIASRQVFTIALSGGSTPTPLYAALAQQDLPWDKIHIFWGDERYVPPTHPDSNEGMTRRVWLDLIPIPAGNIHPMPTNFATPEAAAAEYDRLLQSHFGTAEGEFPIFDLILLGMGDDGHTASLFPHTPALTVIDRSVTVGNKDGQPRLTFTAPTINCARCVIFLLSGASKQPALDRVLAPEGDTDTYPSRLIQPTSELWWLLHDLRSSN